MQTRKLALLLVGAIALSTISGAQAYDRRVRIINDSSYAMVRFFGSNVSTNS
jgi:hypothetical protein